MQNMTIDDLVSLAERIPNSGILLQTLQHHPEIDFESVVLVGDCSDYDDPRINTLTFD